MAQTHHLSRAAYERLKAEHDDLTTRGRIEIAQAIERARELGDLSENGDYHAAKEEQGKMEGRIRHLTALLENSEIVEGGDSDVVRAGSIEERHDNLEVMSPGSPLGQALLGHRVGDVVDYETPAGKVLKVEIVGLEG